MDSMPLFALKDSRHDTQIYAREPEHIIEVARHYHGRAREANVLGDPRCFPWMREVPRLENIAEVQEGRIAYHVGMINFNPADVDLNGEFWSEELQVTPDFVIATTLESVARFDEHRQRLQSSKRGSLYKLDIPGAFGGLYFIPEAVVQGIAMYDLTPHLEKARPLLEKIAEVRRSHPNIR